MADEIKKAKDENGRPPTTRAEFEAGIVAKAWKDPEYKRRLLADPKKVLEEEIAGMNPGVKLPASLEVYVHEETPHMLHFTLPVNPGTGEKISGDEWMDAASGGEAAIAVSTIVTIPSTAMINVTLVATNPGFGVGTLNVMANSMVNVVVGR